MYNRVFKRIIDLAIAVGAVILVGPFILVVAILIRWNMGSPVLFRQKRPGLSIQIFTLYNEQVEL